MPDDPDEVAGGFLGELRGEGVPLRLELVEFHLDQLVMLEGGVETSEEFGTETVFADFEGGFEALGFGFDPSNLGIGDN